MENQTLEDTYEETLLPFQEDIFIHHELKKDSPFLMDKVSIIHGEIPIDQEEKEGTIDVISSKEDWYNHWIYWRNYLETNYRTDEFLREWCKNCTRNNHDYFLVIMHCINTYQDIIFLDITDLEEEPPHQEALLIVPEWITEKQYQTLEEKEDYFSSYQKIQIQGGKSVEDPDLYFDSYEEFPINQTILGSSFKEFLNNTLKEYQKKQRIEK